MGLPSSASSAGSSATARSILARCDAAGAYLWRKPDGRIGFECPAGLPADLAAAITANRDAVFALLRPAPAERWYVAPDLDVIAVPAALAARGEPITFGTRIYRELTPERFWAAARGLETQTADPAYPAACERLGDMLTYLRAYWRADQIDRACGGGGGQRAAELFQRRHVAPPVG